jgi:hypothetical protein
MTNPFPKLTAEVRRHPDNERLLDELGAYLTSVAIASTKPPHSKRYDFYEYIDEMQKRKGGDASA